MSCLRLVGPSRETQREARFFVGMVAVMVVAVFVLLGSLVLAGAKVMEARVLRAENEKLREAFAVLRERSPWSCDIAEGERIICAVKEGTLSRLALTESDQLVSARGIASPLGKASTKKRKGGAR